MYAIGKCRVKNAPFEWTSLLPCFLKWRKIIKIGTIHAVVVYSKNTTYVQKTVFKDFGYNDVYLKLLGSLK